MSINALINARGVSLTRGTKPLFDALNLSIAKGDRIALVGHNGSGKSSLLALLAGADGPDDGEIVRQRGIAIATVEQFVPERLFEKTASEALLDMLDVETRETETYRAELVLHAVGLGDAATRIVGQLSGGQQNLVLVARAMLLEPDVLLMDEPSNHMDVIALQHLRHYLSATRGLTYLMISHDRELLDHCCTRTVFLRDRRTYDFSLPYTAARERLDEQDEQARHRRETQGKEIARIRKSAKRLAIWGKTYDNEDLARKAKTMERRAEKLAQEQTEVTAGSGLDLKVEASALKSRTVLTLEDARVATPDGARELLHCELLVMRPGDRVGLLGANGTGKSSTIRAIMDANRLDASPSIRLNPNVSIGYLDQELTEFDEQTSRLDWLRKRVERGDDAIRSTLLHAGIRYEDFGQAVNTLSGGEKARMMFMRLRLDQPSLLILDEPTNHIDLESREQLETQLMTTAGSLLVTSHDRRFLEAICTRFWLIDNARLREIGDLAEYYDKLAAGAAVAPPDTPEQTATAAANGSAHATELDQVLERIAELEQLLAADVARKRKFQKPARQAEWRAELEDLWLRADALDSAGR